MRIVDRKEFSTIPGTQECLAIDEEGYILISPWEVTNFEIEEDLLEKVMKLENFTQQQIIFQQLLTSFFRKLNFVGEMLLKQDIIYENELKEQYKNIKYAMIIPYSKKGVGKITLSFF